MTLRDFLDAGYALLVSAYQSVGMDVVTAIESVDAAIGITRVDDDGEPRVPAEIDNDASLEELSKLMGNLA
jgi:hypothetical protein